MSNIEVRTGDTPQVEAFLAERIYEYNAAATGYHDGESFTAICEGESGNIEAGSSGYTWGGCCYVSNLWVSESLRGRGIGTEILRAVERHAEEKRCRLVLLSSHTFQAPEFYVRRGYREVARIQDNPLGHADIILAKRLNG